ncbi:Alcohol dehydrogenase 2 [Fusarium oxysporum f. sp. cubense]|uniref:Alcohol dehydrogenase 2 n=1 Tax=Fusarium oxysporum f. sp. cubense TaxID=61366 RepID=A0A559KZ16_FUSOC|nr:Alcohol dehydrogenase 2 [Fusarium oxysporum f. sp. cubense]
MPSHSTNIPTVQKAAVLQGIDVGGAIELVSVPVPVLKTGHILVKMSWSGLCHSDVAIVRNYLPETPFREMALRNAQGVVGHEGVGRVVSMAEDVAAESLWRIGDRVGIKWVSSTCGKCEFCLNGKDKVLCPAQQNPGTTEPGTFQQYAATDARFATRVPEGVSDEEAAPLLCAGLTAFGATKRSQVSAGGWLVILGAGGGVGHLSLQYAKAMGMRTIAVDLGAEKRKLCQELGADHFIDAATEPAITETVLSLTGYGGTSCPTASRKVFQSADCCGEAHGVVMATLDQKAYDMAPNLLRPRGTMVVVAFPKSLTFKAGASPLTMTLKMVSYNSFANFYLYTHEANHSTLQINIVGSTTGTREEMDEVLDLAARRVVRPVVNKAPLKDLDKAMDRLMEGNVLGKVVIQIED